MDASLVGAVIDHFRVVERLGGGGMGTVYKAVDLLLEREVALKCLRPELAREPDLAERFRAEAVILSRLTHPHIASLYSLHRHEADLFMVMEYVPGETLQAHLARRGAVPPREAVRLAVRVLDALDYAHRQGVVHRDIKPANIIVTPDGTPKVMDFGIARVLGSDRRTRLGLTIGTPAYMSPEQIRGLDLDGRSDLYALGVVLYEMLAGRVPFEADSDWALMQAHVYEPPPPLAGAAPMPAELEHVVQRALAKTPDQRYATALHFRLALEAALPDTTEDVRRPTPSIVVAPTVGVGVADREPGGPRQPWHRGSMAAGAGAVAGPGERGGTAGRHETRASRARLRPAAIGASLIIVLLAGWRTWRAGPAAPDAPGAGPVGVSPAASGATGSTSGNRPDGGTSAGAWAQAPAGLQPTTGTPPLPVTPAEWPLPGGPASHREGDGRAGAGVKAPPARPRLPTDGPTGGGTDDNAAWAAAPAGPAASASHGEPAPPPVAPSSTPATSTPAGAGPAVGVLASRPESAETTPEPSNKAAPADGTPGIPPAPARAPVRTGAASPVSFDRIWLLESTGEDVREVGVVLELAGDRLAVLDKATRELRRTLPYHAISDMVYAQSKHPRWKAGAGAAVGVGVFAAPVFFMKNTKHWLTLQGAGEAIVLRLDKNNYRLVLPALEARTGRPVEVATER